MEWDSDRGWFWTVQECDNLARVWTTGFIYFDEFWSEMSQLKEMWEKIKASYMDDLDYNDAIREDVLWQKKHC